MSVGENIIIMYKVKLRNNLTKLLTKCIVTKPDGQIDYYKTADNLIEENVIIDNERKTEK